MVLDTFPYTSTPNPNRVVSVDWWAMSVVLGRPFLSVSDFVLPDFLTVSEQPPTPLWGFRCYFMSSDGNKVATFCCWPKTPCVKSNRAILQISNRFLYGENFVQLCNSLLSCFPMSCTGLNRVDLCCDFEMSADMYAVYNALAADTAYAGSYHVVYSRRDDISCVNQNGGVSLIRIPNQVSFGSPSSSIKWKIYYKWLELNSEGEASYKPHIVNLWDWVGFCHSYVWRCEVSICNVNKFRFSDGSKPSVYDWWLRRDEFFRALYSDKFVVRERQGHVDKRNDKLLTFLDVEGDKMFWYAKGLAGNYGSDPERRIVIKLWREICNEEVCANRLLYEELLQILRFLCQQVDNMDAVSRNFGLSYEDIAAKLQL